MLKVKETSAVDVYAHALNHGDRPVIHGAEIEYDDVHDGVHYHADLLVAANEQWETTLKASETAQRDLNDAASSLAITVNLAEKDGRSPRKFATYDRDLAAYRAAVVARDAAHDAFMAAHECKEGLRAKRDQDAQDAAWSTQSVDSSTHTLPDGRTIIGEDAAEAEMVKAAVAEPVRTPKPGDLCRILGDRVEHRGCDEHPDGTITDFRTGKVVPA